MPDRRSKRLLSSVSVTGPAPRRRSRKDIVREEVEAAAAALPTNSNQTLSHESTRVDNRSHDDNVSTMIPFNKSKLPTSSTACGSDKGVSPRKKLRSDQYSSADPNDAGTTINDKKEAEAADDDLVVVAVTPAAAGIESIALPEGVWEIFSPAYDCYSGITKAPLVSSSITNSSNNNNKALCFASPSPQQRRGNVGTALPSISTALLKKSGTSRRSLAHRYMTTYGADYLCSLQCKERVEHRIQQEHRKLFRLKQDRRQQHAAMLHSSENSARSWESASTTTAILEGQLSGHGGCSNSSPSSSSSSSTPLATQDSTSGRDDMMDEASWENRPLEMGQTRLTAKMRRVLVLWISEVVQQYKLSEATYHLSITLLDAILCHASSHLMPDATAWRIQRTDFQELGCACVWIAAKLEDVAPPLVEDLVFISDYSFSPESISQMETRVCQVMQFRLYRVTPFHFVDTFLRAGRASTQYWCGFDEDEVEGDISRALASRTMMNMTLYLLELSRSCYQLSQECPPSLLAASSVYLARATLGIRSDKRFADIIYDHIKMGPFWSPTLCYYTSYNPSTMAATIVRIHQLHMGAELLSPVYIKYQKDSRRRVSMKTVCRVEDLGLEEWRDGGRNHDDWSVDSNFVIRA